MNKSQLTERLVVSWVGCPLSDKAGLAEQLREGAEFILPRSLVWIVQGTQYSHLPELWI